MNPHSHLDPLPNTGIRRARSRNPLQDVEPGADRPWRIVVMRQRIAEVRQHPITHEAGHVTAERLDRPGAGRLELQQDAAQLLRIDSAGERRGLGHVAEHDRQMPALPLVGGWSGHAAGRLERCPAFRAEAERRHIATSASRALQRNVAATAHTELRLAGNLRLAVLTDHGYIFSQGDRRSPAAPFADYEESIRRGR